MNFIRQPDLSGSIPQGHFEIPKIRQKSESNFMHPGAHMSINRVDFSRAQIGMRNALPKSVKRFSLF